METGRPCYVSLSRLLNLDGDDRRALAARGEKWDSELMSLDDIQYAVLERADFLDMVTRQELPSTVEELMGLLVELALAGQLRRLAGVMIDMPIRVSTPARKRILQAIKTLLSHQVEVVLVDGDGYCVNLLEFEQFCTSRDFVDMYMSGMFSDRWSFGVMSGSSMSGRMGASLSAG
jgi:hypothetical protein